MQINSRQKSLGLFLAAIVAVVAAFGCTQRSRTAPPPAPIQETQMYSGDRAVLVHRGGEGSKRYYRDNNGQLYYVDQDGAVHNIDRKPRVERGVAGLYYIIDDDNVNYHTDDSGRLFYRDSSGRSVYVEDSGAGRVIDPLPLLRGQSYSRIEHTRSLEYCNDAWRKCNSQCIDSSGMSSKRNCFDNCDYQREQCLQPY